MSADEVGWLFVQQYYTTLHKEPSELHKFYSADSHIVHGAEDEPVTLEKGQDGVQALLAARAIEDCKVQVTSIDVVPGIAKSLVVLVLGELSNRGEPAKKFTQTFVLAATGPQDYYVASDILRILSVSAADAVDENATEAVPATETSKETQATEDVSPAPSAAKERAAEAETAPAPRKESSSSDVSESAKSDEASAHRGEPKAGRDKTSWAAAARTFVPLGVANTPQPQYVPIPMYAMPMPMADPRAMHHQHRSPSYFVNYDVEGRAPTNASAIHEAMTQFGSVGHVNHNIERSHGNIQFHDKESAERALAAGGTLVDGHRVNIERRKGRDRAD